MSNNHSQATPATAAPVGSSDSLESRLEGFSIAVAPMAFFAPGRVFAVIAERPPAPREVFFKYALWIGLVPPVCAFVGATLFGWRLGAGEPIVFSVGTAFAICAAYYLALLAGFALAARVALWMRDAYAEDAKPGQCWALIAVVGTPMAAGGVLHLYPSAVLNIAALTPAFLWSVYLLYTGLPVVLKNGPERGMLMASAIMGFALTALAAFMTLIMILWVHGFGPTLGI